MVEGDVIRGNVVKGTEGQKWVPHQGGPQPWLGREAMTSVERGEMRIQNEKE